MATPVLLFNSSTGSDTAASGAGPGTALTGSAASTDGTGLVVTLDGSPDLSGVAIDGTAVLLLIDSTAGNRNFGKITGVDNTAKTVTVANAFGASQSGKAWAIGGKRASLGGTTSRKLFENNSTAGDAMPGWVAELESGYTETISSTITLRRSGDQTDGAIIIRGASGAGTKPVLTFSNNGNAFATALSYFSLQDFTAKNTNATKTGSNLLNLGTSSVGILLDGITMADSTDKFLRCVAAASGAGFHMRNCEVGYCAGDGIQVSNVAVIRNNRIHHCTLNGIAFIAPSTRSTIDIAENDIYANTQDGINRGTNASSSDSVRIDRNTIYGNGGDGIDFGVAAASGTSLFATSITNNILKGNTGYGLNLSGTSMTAVAFNSGGALVAGNVTHGNSGASNGGSCNLSGVLTGGSTSDPGFTNAGTGDFRIDATVRGTGWPTANKPGASYRSYVDPGSAQPDSSGGGYPLLAASNYRLNVDRGDGVLGTCVPAAKATTKIDVTADDGNGEYVAAERYTDPGIANVLATTAYQFNSETNNRTGTATVGGGGGRAYVLGG